MRITLSALVAALLMSGCIEAGPQVPDAAFSPEGPPRVEADVIERHAEQFENELAERPPGSQEEFAAASYITGHLQKAGYVVRLEDVPVANTVRSSDVIALPPRGSDPTVYVTVSMDTRPGERDRDGSDIGAFLEVARALRVVAGAHDIGFVAMGAQSEDALGARRLARLLLDEELEPEIVHLAVTEEEAMWAGPLEEAGFTVERFVGAGEDTATAVLALLTGAEG